MTAPTVTREQVHHASVHVGYEIDSIGNALLRLANDTSGGAGPIDDDLARCFALRLRALAGVLMEVNDFAGRTPTGAQMAEVVEAVFGEVRQVDDGVAE